MVRKMFEGMKPNEKEIMQRFLLRDILRGQYKYNIILDVPDPDFPPNMTEAEKQFWRHKMAKRIDATCETPNEVWILEVTPKVSRAAIGGLLLYRQLYSQQYKPKKPIRLGVIVAFDDPAYHSILEENKIKMWIV